MPCFDSPAVKSTYSARVTCPAVLNVVMSAHRVRVGVRARVGLRAAVAQRRPLRDAFLADQGHGDA
jgi:hypothetical protein